MNENRLKLLTIHSLTIMLIVIAIAIAISPSSQTKIYADENLMNEAGIKNEVEDEARLEVEVINDGIISSEEEISNLLGDKYLIIEKSEKSLFPVEVEDLYMDRSLVVTIRGLTDKSISSIIRVNGDETFTGLPVEVEQEESLDLVKSYQIEYEIGQLVSKSVISEEIVDILASVGLNRPDISILSDEFLEEVKGIPQKNLALELLRRLLDGKIKAMAKKNVVQAKKFSEMLEESVNQYSKKALETAEVIKALVDMAKDMNELHRRGEELGLSDDELAFYDAISENESAKEFYENDVLKQIAKELTLSIKSNMKVDWDVRESVRAQMRITIKRLLRKYKYPPDKQADAVSLIIEQAEKMCESEMQS